MSRSIVVNAIVGLRIANADSIKGRDILPWTRDELSVSPRSNR